MAPGVEFGEVGGVDSEEFGSFFGCEVGEVGE